MNRISLAIAVLLSLILGACVFEPYGDDGLGDRSNNGERSDGANGAADHEPFR